LSGFKQYSWISGENSKVQPHFAATFYSLLFKISIVEELCYWYTESDIQVLNAACNKEGQTIHTFYCMHNEVRKLLKNVTGRIKYDVCVWFFFFWLQMFVFDCVFLTFYIFIHLFFHWIIFIHFWTERLCLDLWYAVLF